MKAVVYDRYGPPEVLEIRDVPKPQPRPKEVLIQIHASTVSSGDWRARSLEMPRGFGPFGRLVFGVRKPKQPILGTELAGTIESVGNQVAKFKTGDAVFGFTGAAMGCHAEYRCMAEHEFIALKPQRLSYDEAATLCFGGLTVLGFFRRANLTRADRVLINGASGSIGVAAIQLAKHFGAHVTAVSSGRNADLVKSLGADEVIDYTSADFTANNARYDIVLDAAGNTPFSRAVKSMTDQGRFIPILGSLSDLLFAPWVAVTSQRKIVAGLAGSRGSDLHLLRDLAETGDYRPVVDRRFTLEQIVDAHRYVDTGRKRGSVVVTMAHNSPGAA